ncbi:MULTISPECIES: alpha/beta hydrolase [unclassified Pseudofrankia]|uniref:alpha/beta hydrolase n=1 Tax=unclassified Pseudofrankia TaxID=2994372 RepID=UPI0008D8E4B4|nr:alpha/beta hydrolase [Pseudofrankia sp. BMG5.36]MDT3446055.1 alpha/beta hydrolase [Pseudofrankia sp. BMG5.37]OHV55381.1 esterase [Pseudofrankia sp. BMG5.36]
MAISDDLPALAVPAREIPVPRSVSPQARAMLAMGRTETREYPALDDADAWRAMIKAADEAVLSMLLGRASGLPSDVEEIEVAGVRVYTIRPQDVPVDDRRVFLDVHGGALIMGGGECCRVMGAGTAARVGAPVWAVDYRMPPDHPYPAPLDDCVAAYRALLEEHRPDEIIVGGASAGGNLAAALILRARDEGLPLPAAAVLNTPEVDLTESGDTFQTNLGVDTVLPRSLMPANLLYAGGHDLADPYLSPLFGDFAKGFPPTLLASGTRDLFLSNTVRMHRALRAAGVPAELHVLEAAPHAAFHGAAPEDRDLDREVRRFVDLHWGRLA